MVQRKSKDAKAKKNTQNQPLEREVIYEEIETRFCAGEDALTGEQSKELLGWIEDRNVAETAGVLEPTVVYRDCKGVKRVAWFMNNIRNRLLHEPLARAYSQEILNRRWAPNGPNGETIIIGKTGIVLSGQHRLFGHVLACEEWDGPNNGHWQEIWPEPPTLETLVVYGVDESPETARTIDNVRPRTLSDVLFADGFFKESMGKTLSKKDQGKICKIADFSVKFLWERTGVKNNAFSPRRTHSEGMEFLHKHPNLRDAIFHTFHTNNGKEGLLQKFLPLGTVSALLYLMAASETDGDVYWDPDHRTEDSVNLSRMEKAKKFWTMLATLSPILKEVRLAFNALVDVSGEGGGTRQEKTTILIKAWNAWIENPAHPVTADQVRPEYEFNDDGDKILVNPPSLGGIDQGPTEKKPRKVKEDETDLSERKPVEDTESPNLSPERSKPGTNKKVKEDPSPEEIEKRAEAERQRRWAEEDRKKREKEAKLEEKKSKQRQEKLQPTRTTPPEEPRPKSGDEQTAETTAEVNGKRKPRPGSRRAVEEEQTRRAREADIQKAREAETASTTDNNSEPDMPYGAPKNRKGKVRAK